LKQRQQGGKQRVDSAFVYLSAARARLPEDGVVRRDDHVAHHGQLAAAAQREAAHRGNQRLAHPPQAVPAGEHAGRRRLRVAQPRHLFYVRAGGEGAAPAAGDGDRPHAAVGVRRARRRHQLLAHLARASDDEKRHG
jgi:hypothetical protein